MIVNVFPEQKRYAFELAGAISGDKARNGFKDLLYARQRDKGFSASSLGRQFEGFLGEVVFADAFGLPRPKLIKGAVDKGYDFILGNARIEVKSTSNSKDCGFDFILEKKALQKEPDLFVFVVFGFGRKAARILGIYRQDFTELMRERDYGYGMRVFVPLGALKPIESFLKPKARMLEEFV